MAKSRSSALTTIGADERVEQRRLAGVGVADDRDGGIEPPVAGAAGGAALLGDLLDPLLELLDALADQAPVGLELGLAGAPGADAAAGARKVGPHPSQPRQLVLELRQLDLEAAFVGLGVQGEDVEDQARAIDDLGLDGLFEGALLGGRKLVVGDQDGVAGLRLCGDELVDLALADVPVGVDMAAVLPLRADDLGAGGVGQAGQLGDRLLGRPARILAAVDGHEKGALHRRGQIDHVFGHPARIAEWANGPHAPQPRRHPPARRLATSSRRSRPG